MWRLLLIPAVLLTGCAARSHVAMRPPVLDPACRTMIMPYAWDEFVTHANRRVQVVDANPERREKDRLKLKREWEAVSNLPCF